MSNQRKAANPNMVILGRESRGLSQKELASRLSVTQGRISKIEMGLLPVSDDLLEALSCILDYPQHFFLQEGSLKGVGIAEVFHRKRQDVPKSVLNKIYAHMEIRLMHLSALLRAVEIPCAVPRFDIDEYDGQVEEIACLVRSKWNLGRGPIQDLTKTLEDAGILVIPIDFETNRVDAISRWIPGLPPLFFVNKHSPKDRYRFSLAHELGHIVMHELPTPDIEEQANRFASEFLLPGREVHVDLSNLNLAKLAILKQYWKVSMAAILMRAQNLGTITDNRARYLWAQMAKAGYKTREPAELDIKGEQPGLLDELIETYRKDLGYSIDDLSQTLALNEEELWSLYLQGHDHPPLRMVHSTCVNDKIIPEHGLGNLQGVGMVTPSKKFEQVTQAIFQRLREQFGYEHIKGSQYYQAKDSGVKRQVDVAAYDNDGRMIIIECKLHKGPVDIGYIDAFHTIIHTDVGANGGIMLSSHGFTSGAIRSAQAKKIALATLDEDAAECDYILQIEDVIWRGVSFTESLTITDEVVLRSVPKE